MLSKQRFLIATIFILSVGCLYSIINLDRFDISQSPLRIAVNRSFAVSPQVQLCQMDSCFKYKTCPVFTNLYFKLHNFSDTSSDKGLVAALLRSDLRVKENRPTCITIALLDDCGNSVSEFRFKIFQIHEKIHEQTNIMIWMNFDSEKFASCVNDFNFITQENPGLLHRAIIVSPFFSKTRYQHGYDIVSGYVENPYGEAFAKALTKRITLAYFDESFTEHQNGMKSLFAQTVDMKNKNGDFIFQFSCEINQKLIKRNSNICVKEETALQNSIFTIIINIPKDPNVLSTLKMQKKLASILRSGSIPVIVGRRFLLPYGELIDWSRLVVQIPIDHMLDLQRILQSFSESVQEALRINGRLAFNEYFSSSDKTVKAVLGVISSRLNFPGIDYVSNNFQYDSSETEMSELAGHERTTTMNILNGLPDSEAEKIACHFPMLKPFDESILQFVNDPGPLNCSAVPDKKNRGKFLYNLLFETDYNSNLIQKQNPADLGFKSCCYKNFTRKSEDEIKYSGLCEPITSNNTRIPAEHEFIIVYCLPDAKAPGMLKNLGSGTSESAASSTNGTTSLIPVDMFNLVRLKPDVEERLRNINNTHDRLNILILGLDSMSHMNFIRTMPKTYQYLTNEMGAIRMNGYTKVGENTFPNIVPALMGKTLPELDPICWNATRKEFFDKCPFIWKNFSEQGYRTAFAEDAVSMSIFNSQEYDKRGFDKPPTDYYLRTLTYSMAKLIGHSSKTYLCYGPRLAFSILLENIKNLVHVMGKEKRYFQFTWATSLFHNDLNFPARGDEVLRDTFQWLLQEGHLENTVLIFMSDHGIRFGAIRDTLQGKIEERMPFLYHRFPKSFAEKYPFAISNMKLNQNRLTTPFDFYEALKDLLHLKNIEDNVIKERHNTLRSTTDPALHPRGLSLFLPIPVRRTCESAGIPEHFCVCHQMKPVSVEDEIVQEAASFVIKTLNEMLQMFPQCSKLSLKEVIRSQVMQMSVNGSDTSVPSTISPGTYSVAIVTVPGDARFEATLDVNRWKKRPWSMVGEISRINEYGTQSSCVTEPNVKMYCFCQ